MLDYYEGIESVLNLKPKVEQWIKGFSGEITDEKEFIYDVQRQLGAFVFSLSKYMQEREAIASHKEKDHNQEICTASNNINELHSMFWSNPILKRHSQEKSFDTALDYLQNVSSFLSKVLHSEYEKLENEADILKEAYDKRVDQLNKLGKYIRNQLNNFQHLNAEEKLFLVSSIEQLNDLCDKDLKPPSNKAKKSDIKNELVSNLANTFFEFTGRTTLKRTSEEISKRKKTPFKELVEICFEALDEKVSENTIKKLLAKVNCKSK